MVGRNRDEAERLRNLLDWPFCGFSAVQTAAEYAEALDIAADFQPHVALIDISVDDPWGCVLMEQLRKTGTETIFFVTSESTDFSFMRRVMRAGARDYLLKPLDRDMVQEAVERIVRENLGGHTADTAIFREGMDPVLGADYKSFSKTTVKVLMAVRNNCRETHSLRSIADTLHMNEKYIGRVFLRDTGLKFTEYLMAYRMLEAMRQIANSQEKISVIAGAVGYRQLNNFHIHFKRFFGFSPSALRRPVSLESGLA